MTLLSKEERDKGLAELGDMITEVTDADIGYFKDKLGRMEMRGATEDAKLQVRKQLKLLEDIAERYRESRPAENE